MGVTVILPRVLCSLFPGCTERVEEVPAQNVAEAIEALDRRWPGMGDRLCDSTPAIRRHINVFVDGEKADLGTVLHSGSEMVVMTAISGGCLIRSSRI